MKIWIAAKHILGYLKGTVGYDLRYTSEDGLKLQRYTDLDRARSAVDRKNTSGCCFNIGSAVVS